MGPQFSQGKNLSTLGEEGTFLVYTIIGGFLRFLLAVSPIKVPWLFLFFLVVLRLLMLLLLAVDIDLTYHGRRLLTTRRTLQGRKDI